MVSIRSPKPAASKTTKNTRAAIRATRDRPLVMLLRAVLATPERLERSNEDTASVMDLVLMPIPFSPASPFW